MTPSPWNPERDGDRPRFPVVIGQLRDPSLCPRCLLPVEGPVCRTCGLDMTAPEITQAREEGLRAAEALDRRGYLVLRAGQRPAAQQRFDQRDRGPAVEAKGTVPGAATAAPAPLPAVSTSADTTTSPTTSAPTPIPPGATRRDALPEYPPVAARPPAATVPVEARPPASPSHFTVQNLLLTVGIALLAVAAIVFLTIAWFTQGLGVRAAIMAALTLGVILIASLLRRRLLATAEAVASLGIVMLALDLWAVRALDVLGAGRPDGAAFWGTGLTVLAGLLVAWRALSGMRAPGLVGALLTGPALGLLLAAGFPPTGPGRTALVAGTAALGGAAGRLWQRRTRARSGTVPLESTALALEGTCAGIVTAFAAFVPLVHPLIPVTPAAVLGTVLGGLGTEGAGLIALPESAVRPGDTSPSSRADPADEQSRPGAGLWPWRAVVIGVGGVLWAGLMPALVSAAVLDDALHPWAMALIVATAVTCGAAAIPLADLVRARPARILALAITSLSLLPTVILAMVRAIHWSQWAALLHPSPRPLPESGDDWPYALGVFLGLAAALVLAATLAARRHHLAERTPLLALLACAVLGWTGLCAPVPVLGLVVMLGAAAVSVAFMLTWPDRPLRPNALPTSAPETGLTESEPVPEPAASRAAGGASVLRPLVVLGPWSALLAAAPTGVVPYLAALALWTALAVTASADRIRRGLSFRASAPLEGVLILAAIPLASAVLLPHAGLRAALWAAAALVFATVAFSPHGFWARGARRRHWAWPALVMVLGFWGPFMAALVPEARDPAWTGVPRALMLGAAAVLVARYGPRRQQGSSSPVAGGLGAVATAVLGFSLSGGGWPPDVRVLVVVVLLTLCVTGLAVRTPGAPLGWERAGLIWGACVPIVVRSLQTAAVSRLPWLPTGAAVPATLATLVAVVAVPVVLVALSRAGHTALSRTGHTGISHDGTAVAPDGGRGAAVPALRITAGAIEALAVLAVPVGLSVVAQGYEVLYMIALALGLAVGAAAAGGIESVVRWGFSALYAVGAVVLVPGAPAAPAGIGLVLAVLLPCAAGCGIVLTRRRPIAPPGVSWAPWAALPVLVWIPFAALPWHFVPSASGLRPIALPILAGIISAAASTTAVVGRRVLPSGAATALATGGCAAAVVSLVTAETASTVASVLLLMGAGGVVLSLDPRRTDQTASPRAPLRWTALTVIWAGWSVLAAAQDLAQATGWLVMGPVAVAFLGLGIGLELSRRSRGPARPVHPEPAILLGAATALFAAPAVVVDDARGAAVPTAACAVVVAMAALLVAPVLVRRARPIGLPIGLGAVVAVMTLTVWAAARAHALGPAWLVLAGSVVAAAALAGTCALALDRSLATASHHPDPVWALGVGATAMMPAVLALPVALALGRPPWPDAGGALWPSLLAALVTAGGGAGAVLVARFRPGGLTTASVGLGLATVSLVLPIVLGAVQGPSAGRPVAEAASVPLGAAALAIGLDRLSRVPTLRTWPALGPGLCLLVLPSYLRELSPGPSGEVGVVAVPVGRLLWLAVLLAAVLVAGLARRWQAPVLLGAIGLVAHALTSFWPGVVAAYRVVPWWLWLGLVGLVLVVIAATYEKRLRDARRAAASIRSLR